MEAAAVQGGALGGGRGGRGGQRRRLPQAQAAGEVGAAASTEGRLLPSPFQPPPFLQKEGEEEEEGGGGEGVGGKVRRAGNRAAAAVDEATESAQSGWFGFKVGFAVWWLCTPPRAQASPSLGRCPGLNCLLWSVLLRCVVLLQRRAEEAASDLKEGVGSKVRSRVEM